MMSLVKQPRMHPNFIRVWSGWGFKNRLKKLREQKVYKEGIAHNCNIYIIVIYYCQGDIVGSDVIWIS